MVYLTRTRLMVESERTVKDRAKFGGGVPQRICSQLLADVPRYSLWHARHENRMNSVAVARQRERQILTLRNLSVEQIHRTALVRYLRDFRITGAARDQTLREFYRVMDTRESAVVEHRNYLIAASTQLCAGDLLELVGDYGGRDLVGLYELAYGQYFSMFCDRARARQNGAVYLLGTLLPEVHDAAERLRRRVLAGELLPARLVSMTHVRQRPRVRISPPTA